MKDRITIGPSLIYVFWHALVAKTSNAPARKEHICNSPFSKIKSLASLTVAILAGKVLRKTNVYYSH